MKTFTIVIPTYNSGATLAISLKSIAQQTYKDVEVLIMDGHSTDSTIEIAEEFKDKIPGLVIHSEQDCGIYDAMNKGIDTATGKWIFFLGSDDSLYDTTILEKVYCASLLASANVLYGNVHIIGDTGWAKDGEIYAGEFTLPKLLNQNICHQALFYKTKFIKEKIGHFNLNYVTCSDWDFNIRSWANAPFQFLDLTVANFLAGGLSTTTNDGEFVEDFVDNLCDYFNIGIFHPLLNSPTFGFYGMVQKKKREEHPLRYKLEKLKKRFVNKFKKMLAGI